MGDMQGLALPHLLVVDDDEVTRTLLHGLLERRGYFCALAPDASEARRLLGQDHFELVLCDITMPGESGVHLARHILSEGGDTAVLMVSSHDDAALAESMLSAGASGYVVKPVRPADLLTQVAGALRRRQADRERSSTPSEMLHRLTRAIELRSEETGDHIARVARSSAELGERLGLDPARVAMIGHAAALHDLGKVAISDRVLKKPGPLSQAERSEIERHCEIGYELLAGSDSEVLELGAEIALTHHEWVDGRGYPQGLEGEEIPIEGRITAVADVFDALTHDRSYRPAFTTDAALEIMESERETHFDPVVLDALLGGLGDKAAA